MQSTGEIQLRSTSHVAAHPVEARRAWATTDQGKTAPWNALFRTDDDGLTWTVPSEDIKADEFLRGVALSPDGKRLYVTGFPRSPTPGAATVLHSSSDGGATWKAVPLGWQLCDGAMPPSCFSPDRVLPIAVDPVEDDLVYLRVETPTLMVLLAARADGTARELLRVASEDKKPGIGGMAFVAEKKAVLVATGEGPYRSIAGGKMERFGNLSRGECLAPRGDALYACGWNFAPDSMAIARAPLADVASGNPTFTKVWNYDETCGP